MADTAIGVVSLIAMLDFAAAHFVELSHRFGLLLGEVNKPIANGKDVPLAKVGELLEHCARLGMRVTVEHILRLIEELHQSNPGKLNATYSGAKLDEVRITDAQLPLPRCAYHAEVLYSTMRAELASRLFKAISPDKSFYSDEKWLMDSTVAAKHPDTVDEFQRAGRCYAYGENTACIFHLMRVTDYYLRRVAASLNIHYDARNWQGIGSKITAEMEKKYQSKTDDWKKNEPFYAEILTDIQAIGRGHRNPALHELDKKYEERDAKYMLTVIEAFARHVAKEL